MPPNLKGTRKELLGEFVWDARSQRYRDAESGKFVSRAAVNRALDAVMGEASRNVVELANMLVNGTVTPAEFALEAAIHVKNAHLCAAALGNGGWDRMTRSDWGRVGRKLRDEFRLLGRWAEQMETGVALIDDRVPLRAGMYVLQAFATYESERRRSHQSTGLFTLERRVLESTFPCDDCLAYADQGWVPIGTLPEIGDSECDGNCRCQFEYMTSEEAE